MLRLGMHPNHKHHVMLYDPPELDGECSKRANEACRSVVLERSEDDECSAGGVSIFGMTLF